MNRTQFSLALIALPTHILIRSLGKSLLPQLPPELAFSTPLSIRGHRPVGPARSKCKTWFLSIPWERIQSFPNRWCLLGLSQGSRLYSRAPSRSDRKQRQSNAFLEPCTYSEGFEGCGPQATQIKQYIDPIRTGHRRR